MFARMMGGAMDGTVAPGGYNMPFEMGRTFGYEDGHGEEEEEMGSYGFTREEEMELLSQGVKPWEDDAHAVLAALRGNYEDYSD